MLRIILHLCLVLPQEETDSGESHKLVFAGSTPAPASLLFCYRRESKKRLSEIYKGYRLIAGTTNEIND